MTDHLLISMDLSGAEWATVGYMAHEPRMMEIHQKKLKAHARTAHYMTGLSEEIILAEYKELEKETNPERLRDRRKEQFPEILEAKWYPQVMVCYQAGKKSGLGFNYDMRYGRFSLENLISEAEAKQMERLYKYQVYPGLTNYYYPSIQQELRGGEECADCGEFRYAYGANGLLWQPFSGEAPERRTDCAVCGARVFTERPPRLLRNCFGRQVRLLGGYGPDLYQQGYSFKPQSTVADSVIQGFCDFYETDSAVYDKAYIWTTTHDELTVMYPIEKDLTDMAETTRALSQEFLRPVLKAPPYEFQLDIDVKIGFRYGDPSGHDKYDGLIGIYPEEPTVEDFKMALEEGIDKLRSAA